MPKLDDRVAGCDIAGDSRCLADAHVVAAAVETGGGVVFSPATPMTSPHLRRLIRTSRCRRFPDGPGWRAEARPCTETAGLVGDPYPVRPCLRELDRLGVRLSAVGSVQRA